MLASRETAVRAPKDYNPCYRYLKEGPHIMETLVSEIGVAQFFEAVIVTRTLEEISGESSACLRVKSVVATNPLCFQRAKFWTWCLRYYMFLLSGGKEGGIAQERHG